MKTFALIYMLIFSPVLTASELLVEVFNENGYNYKRSPDLMEFFKQEIPQGDIYLSYVSNNLKRSFTHIRHKGNTITYCEADFFSFFKTRQIQYNSFKYKDTELGLLYNYKFQNELIGKCNRQMTQNQFKRAFGFSIAKLGVNNNE